MFNVPVPPPPFPVLESFIGGMRLVATHVRLIAVLSFVPFVVTLATMVALRFTGPDMTLFWLPIVQMPSSFAVGLECALLLRFFVLQEYPILTDSEGRLTRNKAVAQSAFIYTAITYFVTGAYAGLTQLRAHILANPEAAAPYAPLMLGGLVLFLWGVRWFWLHIPRALGWQTAGFFERIGKWPGSLRVFALFILCSLLLNFVTSFVRLGIVSVAGTPLRGFGAAFDDAAIAMGTLVLAIVFTATSAAAIRIMMKDKGKGARA